ncbi:hypothetical protein CF392_07595 [Tamilnaduibacter salinus]|uniref:Glycosyltransferase 2-like domain-containing protein n=1 Tax=Tamilnaduibacter salinus TaxID=1484056 RepID=A0A2A2I457_9GAMM|nr:glycosyltransferase family 2 protein [Tamilnaduibacter salinus]PAV26086.1 hypothetical protein CF392_07595 [Tamilnaduibacter salinus]
MQENRVTVYIPTKNREEKIRRAVNSVLSQTHENLELIVVNDGSTDGTGAYLSSIDDTRVVCISNETSLGACESRNAAIRAASGRYITGLDDDDWFYPDHLEKLLRCFDENFSFVAFKPLPAVSWPVPLPYREVTAGDLLHHNFVGNQVLTLTTRLKSINGFDKRFPALQDQEVWIRLSEKFGAGKLYFYNSYHFYQGNDLDRISNNVSYRLSALAQLEEKYSERLAPSHRQSLTIKKYLFSGKRIGGSLLLHSLNRVNFLLCLSNVFKGKLRIGRYSDEVDN